MSPHRTPPTALLALLLVTLSATVLTVAAPPPPALAASSTPGSGWVKADNVGGGCVETATGTYCSSSVTPGSPTLFEYKPDREGYAQGAGPGREHGGDRTAERRDFCEYRGRNFGLAAGIWHHGARWTLVVRNGSLSWQGPTNKHWAFEHTDQCRYDVAPTAIGPTATPYRNPEGTLVVPTDPPWTPPTPTDVPGDDPVPTPTGVPAPTPGPCLRTPVTGLGISATQGGTIYNYLSSTGYAIPGPEIEGDPPGAMLMLSSHITPAWPATKPAGAIVAGVPVDLVFNLTTPYQQFAAREYPLKPFYERGGGKVFLTVIDRGTRLADAADDRILLRVESDSTNPTKNTANEIESGNPVVRIERWDMAPDVTLTGPQLWSKMNWSTGNWFEQEHSHDPGRGDYAAPSDPGWASIIPSMTAGRRYLRSPSIVGVRIIPQADHTYDIAAEVEAKYCSYEWGHNYRLMRLANYTSNPTPTPVSLASGPDVGIRQLTPRIITPGATFSYRLVYDNTRDIATNGITVQDVLPAGVTFTGASPEPSSRNGQTLTWTFPLLPGRGAPSAKAYGEILITVRVNADAPDTLRNVATVAMQDDGYAGNNLSEATTRVIRLPAPQGGFRLRIHSDLDPQQGVYTSSGSAIRWPANEVLDFAPLIALQPAPQPPDGLYTVSQRIVAWSFARLGQAAIGEPDVCKAGTEPTASDLEGADLTELDGCPYRYLANPTVSEMRGMAHAYWSQTLPATMRSDVYVQTPLPVGPAGLTLEYAVLTIARENGTDLDGDGSTSSTLVRSTTVRSGTFQVTLLAPRSNR